MKIPPFDFLQICSGVSLQDFELDRLNQAANLRKDLEVLKDALLQAESEALLARWLIDYREKMLAASRARELQSSFDFNSHLALPAAPLPALPRGTKKQKENSHDVRAKSERSDRREAS